MAGNDMFASVQKYFEGLGLPSNSIVVVMVLFLVGVLIRKVAMVNHKHTSMLVVMDLLVSRDVLTDDPAFCPLSPSRVLLLTGHHWIHSIAIASGVVTCCGIQNEAVS